MRENEASKYFHEFLRLKGQDEVYEIYLENKHHIKSLTKASNKSPNEEATQAYELFDKGNNPVDLLINVNKVPFLR